MSVLSAVAVRALLKHAAETRPGLLTITGEPGGLVHLAGGGIRAVLTPGAPGADLVLLSSGRVPAAAWEAAYTAAAASGRLAAELVARRLVGARELEAVLRAALADAMFAVLGGEVTGCVLEGDGAACLLPLEPPVAADWLLAETARRMRVLSAMPGLVRHDRDRLTPGPAAPGTRGMLTPEQDELLALANGRRTARDMAFVLGRGVYPLTLELSGMQAAGLIAVSSQRANGPAKAQAAPWSPAEAAETAGSSAPALPRRRQPGRAPRHAPGDVIPPAGGTVPRLRGIFPPAGRDQAAQAGREQAGQARSDPDGT